MGPKLLLFRMACTSPARLQLSRFLQRFAAARSCAPTSATRQLPQVPCPARIACCHHQQARSPQLLEKPVHPHHESRVTLLQALLCPPPASPARAIFPSTSLLANQCSPPSPHRSL